MIDLPAIVGFNWDDGSAPETLDEDDLAAPATALARLDQGGGQCP